MTEIGAETQKLMNKKQKGGFSGLENFSEAKNSKIIWTFWGCFWTKVVFSWSFWGVKTQKSGHFGGVFGHFGHYKWRYIKGCLSKKSALESL